MSAVFKSFQLCIDLRQCFGRACAQLPQISSFCEGCDLSALPHGLAWPGAPQCRPLLLQNCCDSTALHVSFRKASTMQIPASAHFCAKNEQRKSVAHMASTACFVQLGLSVHTCAFDPDMVLNAVYRGVPAMQYCNISYIFL